MREAKDATGFAHSLVTQFDWARGDSAFRGREEDYARADAARDELLRYIAELESAITAKKLTAAQERVVSRQATHPRSV